MSLITKFAKGFRATGLGCGIKSKNKDKLDLAMIVSEYPCTAAGVFTQNTFRAAPVLNCVDLLAKHSSGVLPHVNSIVINSGNANACTGEVGKTHANLMAQLCSKALNVNSNQDQDLTNSLVMSTGVIGQSLTAYWPGIKEGISEAGLKLLKQQQFIEISNLLDR